MGKPLPVFFHVGHELNLKTRARKGLAHLDGTSLKICESGTGAEINFLTESMRSVAFVRPHMMGSVIKIDLGSEYLFISVTRFMVGQFALVNHFGTARLYNALSATSAGPSTSEFPIRPPLSKSRRFAIFMISALVSFSCIAVLSFLKRYW